MSTVFEWVSNSFIIQVILTWELCVLFWFAFSACIAFKELALRDEDKGKKKRNFLTRIILDAFYEKKKANEKAFDKENPDVNA